ncbi:hypothetical protein JCM19301_1338 [Jejuia pallidilutea]|uniref:Uncharacterized protein n=1 Tax=Jejuia pallidilutea TaxID=504487 RepID=A0A090VU41_9FLAO|nr:hypothetical protein JCM19301_1338 [Jejuia pallidilutea]
MSRKDDPILMDLLGIILNKSGSLLDAIILMLFIFGTVLNRFKTLTR